MGPMLKIVLRLQVTNFLDKLECLLLAILKSLVSDNQPSLFALSVAEEKAFIFVTDTHHKLATVFVDDKSFQPSLTFVDKTQSLPKCG
jgi:hypothetical protein